MWGRWNMLVMKDGSGFDDDGFLSHVAPITVASFVHLSRTGVLQRADLPPHPAEFRASGRATPRRRHRRAGISGSGRVQRSAPSPRRAFHGSLRRPQLSRKSVLRLPRLHPHAATSTTSTRDLGRWSPGWTRLTKLAATPLADPQAGRPVKPPVIENIEVKPVRRRTIHMRICST